MPAECDGCRSAFSLEHALDCRKCGLVTTQCHNEVRDALGVTAAMTFEEVIREPVMGEAGYQRGVSAVITDLGIRGVWHPQTKAFFDICVMDTDTWFHDQRSVTAVLASAEEEKKRRYLQAVKGC